MFGRPAKCGPLHFAWAVRLALGLLALAAPLTARGEWFADAQTGAFYDTNLTRAYEHADIRADGAAALAGRAGWFQAISGDDGLTLALDAHTDLYHRFHGLNDVGVGSLIAYKHKFGLGFAAPWVSLSASLAYDNYDSDIRDGDRLNLSAEFGKRFVEKFDASFGAIFDRRYATTDTPVVPGISGKAFATQGQSAFVRASYDLTDRLQLGARLSVRRGDVVSTTRPDLAIFVASDAIAPDPTFGPDFYAYRLRGTTDTAAATLSWALSDRSSLNFGYVGARTRAMQGLEYRSGTTNVTLAYRY